MTNFIDAICIVFLISGLLFLTYRGLNLFFKAIYVIAKILAVFMIVAITYKYFGDWLWNIDQSTGGHIFSEIRNSVFIDKTIGHLNILYKDPPVEEEQPQSHFYDNFNWVFNIVYPVPPPPPPEPSMLDRIPIEYLVQKIKLLLKGLKFIWEFFFKKSEWTLYLL